MSLLPKPIFQSTHFALREEVHEVRNNRVISNYPIPDLFFVGTTSLYTCPGFGVGGIGLFLVLVISFPVFPLLGSIISYWPDLGVFSPGLIGIAFP